jgi:OOP family OmpA-OmpF porin
MAVSQFLRPGSLVDTITGYLTPNVVRNASSIVGEPESSTFHAMRSTVPALLGGLLNFSSSHEGANTLAGMARDSGYGAAVENPASLFAGGTSTSNVMSVGQSMTGTIFGNKASSVRDAIASSSGVKASSASTLMSLLAPLTLGTVWKMAGPQGQNGDGIANLLRSQQREIAEAAPSGLSRVLGVGGRPVTTPAPSALYEERVGSGVGRWLPLLLVALAALGLLLWALSRRPRVAEAPRAPVVATPSAPVPEYTVSSNLAQYLASGDPAPRTFTFDHLNFETASTELAPGSGQTVANLASTLKAYPNAQIQLAGHTDNTGDPQANQQLSLNRANAVKAMLVSSGISADRISTAGYGQDHPLASNDTEEGRAKNRRTELTVTSK